MCTTKKGAFLGSGITLIILSILMIIWQIANDVLLGLLSLLVLRTVGYWAGVLYLVVGILSAVAGRDLKKCPVIGAFVMSIIAIVIAGLGSLIIHGQTVAVVAIYSGAAAQNNQQQAVLDSVGALWIPPLIISVLCFIFNLVILVLTSTVICCGSKDDQILGYHVAPPVVLLAYHLLLGRTLPHSGRLSVTDMCDDNRSTINFLRDEILKPCIL